MGIVAFCRRRRVNRERLRYWQRVLADRGAGRSGFVEIRPSRRRSVANAAVAPAAALELRLPDGVRIAVGTGFDAALLRAVVEALS
jgi:hypothetical protein